MTGVQTCALPISEPSHLWHIKYPFKDGNGYVTVATTRPETLLGDTAVAVNPKDARYAGMEGRMLVLPLVGREIPIVFDEYVEKDFGTGAVKITPAHDPNDFEVGKRHDLPVIRVMNDDGTMNGEAGKYEGMTREDARAAIVADLSARGLLEKTEDYTHNVGHCERCKTTVEPMVSKQWFVRMKELAEPAIDAVKTGKIKFIPKRFEKTYYNWMNNIRDWCISRQLWWGHRFLLRRVRQADGEQDRYRHLPALRRQAAPRSRRARHLVLVRAVAVLDYGLAGQNRGSSKVLSDGSSRHGIRYNHAVGVAHDILRHQVRRRRAF